MKAISLKHTPPEHRGPVVKALIRLFQVTYPIDDYCVDSLLAELNYELKAWAYQHYEMDITDAEIRSFILGHGFSEGVLDYMLVDRQFL